MVNNKHSTYVTNLNAVHLLIPYSNFYSLQTYRKNPARDDKAKEMMRNHINGTSPCANGAKHKQQ